MNTAARMESTRTSEKQMIQISQATADLLVAAGKTHWLTPREDVVIAKGKGGMHTFWNPAEKRFRIRQWRRICFFYGRGEC